MKHKMAQAALFDAKNDSKNVTAKRLPFIYFKYVRSRNEFLEYF